MKWLAALLVVVSRVASAQNVEPSAPAGLSDADLLKLSQGEAIEIDDERPDKPFVRDTEVRLTGEQLAARGAVDLGTALALLPDVIVRDAGRGGFSVDIRGARKGAVSVLVDGVLVTDPYYGTFVIARMWGDSQSSLGISGTARAALSKHLALRVADDPLDRLPHSRGEAWVQVTPEPRVSLLARVLAFGSSIDQTKVVPGYAIVQATATAPRDALRVSQRRARDLGCKDSGDEVEVR